MRERSSPNGPGLRAVWWFLVPLLSLGLLTPAAIFYAGLRMRSRATMISAAVYALFEVLYVVHPESAHLFAVALYMSLCWLGGTVHAALLSERHRREWPRRVVPVQSSGDHAVARPDRALTAARQNQQRRLESRRILEDEPGLAADLRIGRPDLRRTYDDGGLIDVNHVPEVFLISELEMEPAVAREVVRMRVRRNGFSSADDMLIACDSLNPQRLEMLRDRLIFVPRDLLREGLQDVTELPG
jgi:hypothetical protein